MGHYTGVATQLRVKKTAPKHLVDFVDYLYSIGVEQPEPPAPRNQEQEDIHKVTSTIHSMLTSGSGCSYFPTWYWRVKEDKGDHWLYESRASSKVVSEAMFVMLVSGIQENLMLEEGDILLRSITEDGSLERVVYFTNNEFKEADGFSYKTDHGYVIDYRHPYGDKRNAGENANWNVGVRHETGGDDLPWKYEEVMALKAKEKKERDASWHPWG